MPPVIAAALISLTAEAGLAGASAFLASTAFGSLTYASIAAYAITTAAPVGGGYLNLRDEVAPEAPENPT